MSTALIQLTRLETQIRAAILEVLDAGDEENPGLGWCSLHPFADVSNDARLRLADRILERFKELEKSHG